VQRLVEEVRKVRDEAGSLPPEQRRDRAAAVALQLAALLGEDEDEE
ncbi:unnamed protein product, partial [Choristocarpus tenellus]